MIFALLYSALSVWALYQAISGAPQPSAYWLWMGLSAAFGGVASERIDSALKGSDNR
jgi:multidrug transporter EmrE-like cation transporter